MSVRVRKPGVPMWMEVRSESLHPGRILRLAGFAHPPLDIIGVLGLLEVKVVFQQSTGLWAGWVDANPADATLYVSSRENEVRRRFILAHGLAHLILFPSQTPHADVAFNETPEEHQANKFAADLLMPPALLGPLQSAYYKDENHVDTLAGIFNVSIEAMTAQLHRLVHG